MKTKIVFSNNVGSLIARYNPFYKCYDYYMRILISGELIEIELNYFETSYLNNTKNFKEVFKMTYPRHEEDCDVIRKNTIASYIIEEYGLLTPGIYKLVQDLTKFPALAKEFYENVIVKETIPENGMRIKGYTAFELSEDKNISPVQAYIALVNIARDMNKPPKEEEVKVKKHKLISDETMVMGNVK